MGLVVVGEGGGSGVLLLLEVFADLVGEEDVGGGVGEVFLGEGVDVVDVVGGAFEEAGCEVAVFRAWEVAAAGAVLEFELEVPGGVFADDVGVASAEGFPVAFAGVGVDAVFEVLAARATGGR